MWITCAISVLLLIASALPTAKGQEANLPNLPEAIQLLQLESMNELRKTIQDQEVIIADQQAKIAKLEENGGAKDELIVTLRAEKSQLTVESAEKVFESKSQCEKEKMEIESQKMKELEKMKTKLGQSDTTIIYMTNVMLQSNEVSKEMQGLLEVQATTIKEANEEIKRQRNVTSMCEAAANTIALQAETTSMLKSSLASALDVPRLSTSDLTQLDVAPFMLDLMETSDKQTTIIANLKAVLEDLKQEHMSDMAKDLAHMASVKTSATANLAIMEEQAHMIQNQEKLITQMVPLLRHASNDMIWYEGAENREISNRTFSLPCPGGACLSPELPSCIEPLEWEESDMVSHQCQETIFKGETILCGKNSTKEVRMRIEMGGGTVEEVTTSPCLDCSEGLIWTGWEPCTDQFQTEDVIEGRECRRRGNENMGFEDEDRDAIWTPLFSRSAPFTLDQNNLVTTLDILPREWMVDFMVKPTSVPSSDIRSILHLTDKEEEINTSRYGGRIPALWFYSGELRIECAEDNAGKRGKRTITLPQPPIGKWTRITLTQEYLSGESRYRVLIDGVEKD